MKRAWTPTAPLPGGDFGDAASTASRDVAARAIRSIPTDAGSSACSAATAARRGVLGDAREPADLGEHFGGGLTERELAYLVEREWARDRRGRAVAPHEVRPAHDRGASARASRGCMSAHA